jgi:alpha-tubulin suppressor-like RCC1 family protein
MKHNLFRIRAGGAWILALTVCLRLSAAPAYVTGWGANALRQLEPPLPLSDAVSVSAGFAHAVALRADGSVVAWGDDSYGQIAIPAAATNVVAVAAGHRHNLALRADGSLLGWGDNSSGQLIAPAEATNLVAVAAGSTHSLALRADGSVVVWGGNSSGQGISPPALNLTNVQAIAAGAFHNVALRTNGAVVAWGYNGNGQTSVPSGLSNVVAIASGFNHNLALRADGAVLAWGYNGQGQTNVPAGLSNVVEIAAGFAHSVTLKQDGTVVAWGGTVAGEAVPPEGLAHLSQVAAGAGFTLAITPGPAVLRQPENVLLVPGSTVAFRAVVAGDASLALQWQRDGVDIPGATNATLSLRDVQYDQFGDYRLHLVDASGAVFSQVAQLIAPPAILSQPESAQVYYGTNVTFRVTATGTQPLSYQWYFDDSPITAATNSSLIRSNLTYRLGGGYHVVVSNAAGAVTSSVARLTLYSQPDIVWRWTTTEVAYDGTLGLECSFAGVSPESVQWQWNGMDVPNPATGQFRVDHARPGHSGAYRLLAFTPAGPVASSDIEVNVGRAEPVNFAGRRTVLDAGDPFGLVRGTRWFRNGAEIPNQTNTTLVIESLAPADAGNYTVICRYDGGMERSFEVAQLTVLPPPAAGRIVSWGYPNSIPGAPVTQLQDAVAIAMGDVHLLALRADGRIFSWGYSGQSSANTWRALEPVVVISAKADGGAVLGASGQATSDTWEYCYPCPALDNNRYVDVAFGSGFGIGLRSDGTVVGWGYNGGGQTSVPSDLQGVVAVAAGWAHALALRNDGTVVAWGDNSYGQTAVPVGLSGVKAVTCGWNHCLALRSNGTVTAWGNNSSGQCALPGGLTGVLAIGAGSSQSFAVLSNGSVLAWGDNSFGQCTPPSDLTGVVSVAGGYSTASALVGSTNHPAILQHPSGGIREIGDEFTFEARAWSAAPLSYQWQRQGTNLPGATNPSLSFTNVQLADEGDYTISVTTSAGTVASDIATLLVNPPPFLSLSNRGRLFVWGGQSASAIPPGLGEVAAVSAGPESYTTYTIGTDGTARGWNASFLITFPDSPLVSVVQSFQPDGNTRYLGLQDNGVVRAWSSSLEEILPPPGLRNVTQLVGNGTGGYIAVHADGTIQHPYATDFFPTNLANVVQASVGWYHSVVLRADGTVVLSQLDYHSEQTPVPDGLSNVVSIAAGGQHTLALLRDSTVFAWGRTNEGQCLVPAGLSNVVAIAAGDNFSMALRGNGTVAVWGDNSAGQAGIPLGLSNVVAIAAGYNHCLALQRGPVLVTPLADLNVPSGELATFEVNVAGAAPLRYQWFLAGHPIPEATNQTLTIVASPDTEGLYSVTVSNADGSVSAEAMLWLGLPPEILAGPDGGLIPVGGSWTFMVLASGLGPLRCQWQSNGTNLVGATNSLYPITSASTNRSGDYRVIVSNAFGAATSQVAQLTVLPPPTFVSQPVSMTRAEGETAQFSVVTGGGQPQSFQWQFQGLTLEGETNATLTIPNLTTNHAGVYAVVVSNPVRTLTSASATLSVVAPSPQILSAPQDQVAGFGNTVRWAVVAVGANPLEYQWFFNGAPLSGAVASSLVISNVDSHLAGSYHVVVSNTAGSVTTDPALLTLQVRPNVVVWGTNESVRTVPPALTNAVAVAASAQVLALRDDGTVAAWGDNSDGQANVPPGLSNVVAVAAGAAHSVALQSDGRVLAWGRNALGETGVPADLTNAVAIAAGSSHTLAIRSDGTLVGWGYNAYEQSTPPVGLSNAVSVTANFDASVVLKADGTITRWGNGYIPPANLSNVVKVMGRARMLALRSDGRIRGWGWTSGGGVEGPPGILTADSYYVPYQPRPGVTQIETHEIGLLTNGTVAIWGTNRGAIFNVPPGLSNVLGVSAGSFFNAAVVGGPTIVAQPQDLAAAVGTDGSFEVQAVSRFPLQYQWRFNGTNLSRATNATLTLSALTPARSGSYSVVVRDSTGVVTSRAAALRVLSDQPYFTRQPVSASVGEGIPARFEVGAEGTAPLEYQWFHNGAPVAGATQSVFQIPAASATDAGFYSVRVANAYGVVISPEALLTIGVGEVIVDNTSAAVIGPWQVGFNPSQIGTNYLFIPQGMGASQVRFVPALPRTGNYRVYSRFFNEFQSELTPALHVVHHGEGSTAVLPGGTITGWSLLGTFPFTDPSGATVEVLDAFPNGGALGLADAIRFTYVPSPPTILSQPGNTDVVENTGLSLAVSATGALPLAYQWQFNGTNLPGATNPVLTIASLQRSQAGPYRVRVSNPDGALYSQDATVRVVAPPLQLSVEEGAWVLRWSGDAILQTALEVTGPYEDVPGGTSPLTLFPDETQRFYRLKD